MSKTISARIDDTMHTMITDEANQEGITVNEKLKGMLNNHFNGEEKKEIFQSQNEASEKEILELRQNQEKQVKLEQELFKLIDRISNRITEGEIKILQAVDQRLDDHERKYKHEKEFHSSLKCNNNEF